MAGHTTTGVQGEEIAARYLLSKKYEIVQRNYRCRYGEIDIIARKKKFWFLSRLKRDAIMPLAHRWRRFR